MRRDLDDRAIEDFFEIDPQGGGLVRKKLLE
jgi:hypothetical protein